MLEQPGISEYIWAVIGRHGEIGSAEPTKRKSTVGMDLNGS